MLLLKSTFDMSNIDRGVAFTASINPTSIGYSYPNFCLSNPDNTISFCIQPIFGDTSNCRLMVNTTTSIINELGYKVRVGNQSVEKILASGKPSYKIRLDVRGHSLFASVTCYQDNNTIFYKEATIQASTSELVNVSSNWRLSIESASRGSGTGFTMDEFTLSFDEGGKSNLITEYFVIDSKILSEKSVFLREIPTEDISINIAQATMQKAGVDFMVLDRKLSWSGMTIDRPELMKLGIGIRVTYEAKVHTAPRVEKISKRIVCLNYAKNEILKTPWQPEDTGNFELEDGNT